MAKEFKKRDISEFVFIKLDVLIGVPTEYFRIVREQGYGKFHTTAVQIASKQGQIIEYEALTARFDRVENRKPYSLTIWFKSPYELIKVLTPKPVEMTPSQLVDAGFGEFIS